MGEVVGAAGIGPDGREREYGDASALPSADAVLELRYAYAPGLLPRGPMRGGMWRYRALLPLGPGPVRYPLPVGGTPLLALARPRAESGLPRLFLKDESRGPSGSNKDRATAIVLEEALRRGIPTVSCASTGNVAVSLAIGAAAAGVRAVVFVPDRVDPTRLRLLHAAGATVLRVAEGYERAFALSREAARAFGWLDRNTGINPATTEAKKTVAFEVWEQLGRRVPDVVVAPVGDGVTLAAFAKGFREIIACGGATRPPRLVAVQAEGAAPLAEAFGRGRPPRAVEPRTIADGIAVGSPVAGALVLRDVAASRGAFVTVSDAALLDAVRRLARAGVLAEPAGAAAYAGVLAAREAGLLGAGESVVALVTGTALKTPQHLPAAGEDRVIEPSVEAVARAVGEPPGMA